MLYGKVDGPPLSQLVGGRRDGIATDSVLFRDVKVNPTYIRELIIKGVDNAILYTF